MRDITVELLDDFVARGGGDWVDMVAAPLPIRVILAMLGVPVADAEYLVELSNYLVEGTSDTQSIPPDAFGNTTELRLLPFNSPASHALFEYSDEMRSKRRAEPRDDLVTQSGEGRSRRRAHLKARVPPSVPSAGLRRERDNPDGHQPRSHGPGRPSRPVAADPGQR